DLRIVDELYCLQRNFPEVPLGELLTWASRNGAEFLARPEFGTIEPGKRPGLVFIDHLDADGRLTAASKSHRL
ncbi:MAG: amidohydrolase family protein, partial [Bacteroidales bacterium]|nr:amidohydrolase family protein [Bacteroidales bacterium]